MGVMIQAFLVTLCVTTLLNPGLAQLPTVPGFTLPDSPVDLTKCWSSLFSVEGCIIQIYKSTLTGKFENVGPTCCKAFTEVDAKCWPKMFPLNPIFPPLLKNGCSRINAAAPTQTTPQFPTIPGFSLPDFSVDVKKCWSSLVDVRGCVTEIYKSFLEGKFGHVGPMCCKAVSAIDEKCWPQMFPLNTFFPPLLKKQCSSINAATPTQVV